MGKMEGDMLGIFQFECLYHLYGERITYGGKGAMKIGRSMGTLTYRPLGKILRLKKMDGKVALD